MKLILVIDYTGPLLKVQAVKCRLSYFSGDFNSQCFLVELLGIL